MRYQNGCRTPSLMMHINGYAFKGTDEKIYTTLFRLNKRAKDLLLTDKLHKISPKCCYYLKKKTAHDFEKTTGLKAILGIRGQEGALRKTQYKSCFTKDMKFTPIHDLTDELLNKIYDKYNIEIPSVYKHIERTGCMGCPYGSYRGDTQKELNLLNDRQRQFVIEYFRESYQVLGIDTTKQLTIYDYLEGGMDDDNN
jgi:3'-phosphoadenosine 5'-phosphosulfate sulfotransferase (PAPS reductase)/FAD synthetase